MANQSDKIPRPLATTRRIDINMAVIFTAYALLRLFLPFAAYWIYGDEAKYLACARSFPFNLMFNHSFYDYHPVFYPYMIRLFNLFFVDHIAAIAVSFFSSLALFFVAWRLFLFLGLKKRQIYIALTYMAFNNILLSYSRLIFRYQLFVCLFFLSFYLYLKGISTVKGRYLFLSALFGGLTFMTSDMMPFMLLLALLGAFFIFGFRTGSGLAIQCKKIFPLFLIIMIYISCVLLPRFMVYSRHIYYAGGWEGRIEKVDEFGPRQLINPILFPNSMSVNRDLTFRVDLNPIHIKERVFSLISLYKYDDTFYNWLILIFIALPVILLFFKLLSAAATYFNDRQGGLEAFNRDKTDLYFAVITIGFFYPVIYSGYIARYSIAAIPFLAYFLSKGVDIFLSLKVMKKLASRKALRYFGIFMIIFITIMIMKKSHHFIFTLGRVETCDKAGAYLDALPKDGVLAEGLLSDALVYNCHKRVVTLPRSLLLKPAKEQIELSIRVFDLNYVLLSEFWKIESAPYPAIAYIRDNPDKFVLIKTIYENYDQGLSSNTWRKDDTFYIYEIKRDKLVR